MAYKYANRLNNSEEINYDDTEVQQVPRHSVSTNSSTISNNKLSSLKSGDVIAINRFKTYTLLIHIDDQSFLPIYSNVDGVLKSFNELSTHLNKTKTLDTLKTSFAKRIEEYTNSANDVIIYRINIIEYMCQYKGYLTVLEKNLIEMHKLEPGDIVSFNRTYYTHSAIFVDRIRFRVIHRSGEPDNNIIFENPLNKANVVEEYLLDVMLTSEFYKDNSLDKKYKPRSPEEVIQHAKSRIGEEGYHLISKNCQHFAHECRYDISHSPEVYKAATVGSTIALGTLIAGAFYGYKYFQNKKKENEEKEKQINTQ